MALTAGALLFSPSAQAASGPVWTVDCVPADLLSAVSAADAAGGGTIDLAAGCTYVFTTPGSNTHSALPVISGLTTPLTINGNGATLQRSSAAGTPNFDLIQVNGAHMSVTINDLTVTGGKDYCCGGGIYDSHAALTLDDDTITGNSTVLTGGGIATAAGSLTVTDSVISNNVQDSSALSGNGILQGGQGGGGLFIGGTATVTGSLIEGNYSSLGGGGARADSADTGNALNVYFTNDTITGNSTPHYSSENGAGAGLHDTGSFMFVTNDTITGNYLTTGFNGWGSALATGGGVNESTVGLFYVRGSIVDGTCEGFIDQTPLGYSTGFNVLVNCSLVNLAVNPTICQRSAPLCGPDTIATTADLGPLEDNGGPTQSMAISSTSPAYQLEPPVDCPAVDQRGVSRPQPPGAGACNAGSYETQAVGTAVAYAGPMAADFGSNLTLSATLTQPAAAIGLPTPAGGGIAGQTVTLGFGAESCSATTDATGTASCQVSVSDAPSTTPYPITVTYAGGPDGVGTDYYQPSSDTSAALTVNPAPTALSATPLRSGISATLSAVDTGAPLPGQTLTFTAGNDVLCTATTGPSGSAGCTGARALWIARRHHGYTVSYAGSSDYLASTATVSAGRRAEGGG